MSKKSKNLITTILLLLTFTQWPLIYYFTSGFIKLLLLGIVAIAGFTLSVILIVKLIRKRSNNTIYHILGLCFSIVIGLSAVINFGSGMEYADFYLRLNERNAVVNDFKNGKLKRVDLPGFYVLPVSNNGNDVEIWKNTHGIVTIGFYIDRGFIDHASFFVYTNDPVQVEKFDDEAGKVQPDTSVVKIKENWYRLGF